MSIRLIKISKDLNVSIPILVKFLNERGHNIEANPNTKIDTNLYQELLFHFNLKWDDDHRKYIIGLKTKPFIILAGISGIGKTRLVRELAQKFNTTDLSNYELIEVKPNWHDSSELIGYYSAIEKKYKPTQFLRFVIKAIVNPNKAFFICLDEMNLAPVEQYFAEYLSLIESREIRDDKIISLPILSKVKLGQQSYKELVEDLILDLIETDNNATPDILNDIYIPENLFVFGTVNMDDTTHSFSRKVLDRALTIELTNVDMEDGLIEETNKKVKSLINVKYDYLPKTVSAKEAYDKLGSDIGVDIIYSLTRINEIFDNTSFKIAYRTRNEILLYCYYNSTIADKPNNWFEIAFDEIIYMKILSRIEGEESTIRNIIKDLIEFLSSKFSLSNSLSMSKLKEMDEKLKFGFTSYWN